MDNFRELLSEDAARSLMLILALGGPIAGLILGAVMGSIRKSMRQFALRGLAWGMAGPAIFMLWHLFIALQNRLGFNSFALVIFGAAGFAAAGVVLGALVARLNRAG